MPVPDYQTLMLPLLKLFAGGKTKVSECFVDLKAEFSITDEEAEEILPSGQTYLYNRVHWARTYLGKAGLLTSPKRGVHEITEKGRQFLETNPQELNTKALEKFDGFIEWRSNTSNATKNRPRFSNKEKPILHRKRRKTRLQRPAMNLTLLCEKNF